jgi:hypothetical protein
MSAMLRIFPATRLSRIKIVEMSAMLYLRVARLD